MTAFDFGAYGTLKAVAELDDGTKVTAHLQGHEAETLATLPLDRNGNHIADSWETVWAGKRASTAPTADADALPPGDGRLGDALPMFEEYRGFMVLEEGKPKHIRTSAKSKDVFVFNPAGFTSGSLNRTELDVHEVDENGYALEDGAFNRHVMNPKPGLRHSGAAVRRRADEHPPGRRGAGAHRRSRPQHSPVGPA